MATLPPSRRGRKNLQPSLLDYDRKLDANRYDLETNPQGIVDLGRSQVDFMREELASWLDRNLTPSELSGEFKYNVSEGSPALLQAAAGFMNRVFKSHIPLEPDNMIATNGVSSLLNALSFNLCDEGDTMLFLTPGFGGLIFDAVMRNGVNVVNVPCDDVPDIRFQAHEAPGSESGELAVEIVHRLETALETETAGGNTVTTVLLANPENPLGRSYAPEVLLRVSRFCESRGLHLIVDEIFAMTGGKSFTSILSLDLGSNRENVHALWGMSKDFGFGGLRIGFLATYNRLLRETMLTLSYFNWITSFSDTVASRLLADADYLESEYLPLFHQRLDERREHIGRQLDQRGIPYIKPNAGLHMLINLSAWLDGDVTGEGELKLQEEIWKAGVFMMAGQAFCCREPGWFRLCFCVNEDEFSVGLDRLLSRLGTPNGKGH